MVDINYALIGANGDTIEFDYENYVLQDFTGFGVPASVVRIDGSAGDGGVFRYAKRGVRNVDLSVVVMGNDRDDVQTKLRRLAKMTQHTAGALTLEARYSDGKKLQLATYYTGGAEGQWGSDAGLTWCRWGLSLQAPQPYWTSTTVQQFTVTRGASGRGLLPQLAKLRVSSSQALGKVFIDNVGDVPTNPTYRVVGPITDFAVDNGTQGFSFNTPLAAGETVFINTETGEVYDSTGANRYAILGAAPKLFQLPVGTSVLNISGTGVDDNTRVDVYYALRYEVVH